MILTCHPSPVKPLHIQSLLKIAPPTFSNHSECITSSRITGACSYQVNEYSLTQALFSAHSASHLLYISEVFLFFLTVSSSLLLHSSSAFPFLPPSLPFVVLFILSFTGHPVSCSELGARNTKTQGISVDS